jgi:hypothetical protein
MKKVVLTALIMLSTTTLFANEQRAINMGLKVGTLGYGLDVSTPINDNLSARFNINGFSYNDNQDKDGNNYDGTLDLMTMGALLDYYPFTTNFRLSTGVYYNDNKFTGKAIPAQQSITIGDTTYQNTVVESLDASISFNSFSPYLGIGWGNDAHDAGWGFTFDVGAMYHGTPQGDLNVNYAPNVTDTIKNEVNTELVKEQKNVQDDLNAFKFYPVVAIGVNYTF